MKKQKRRPKRRRRAGRGPGIILKLLCAVLMVGGALCAVTIFFRIKTVEVVGESRYNNSEILEAAGIEAGDNMFFMDKLGATRRIFDSRAYIGEVKIVRRLPDKIEIQINAAAPVASVRMEDAYYLMDKTGKILEKVTEEIAKTTCYIEGIEAESAEVGKIVTFSEKDKQKGLFSVLNSANESGILSSIISINVEKTFEISLTYENRFTVQLGTSQDLDKKFAFLLKVLDELGTADTGTIDLSDPRTARFRPQ